MKLLIARVEWMPQYTGEQPKNPISGWVQGGNFPNEAYNFLCARDGNYHGYWRVGEKRKTSEPAIMHFSNWDDANEPIAKGVTVVFVAKSPDTGKNVVVGFYRDAEVLAAGDERPNGMGRYRARTSASNGFLIPEEDRVYHYNYRSKSGWFTYGNPDLEEDINLLRFVAGLSEESDQAPEHHGLEGRRIIWARRIERFQSPWLRSLAIKSDADLVCAACGLRQLLGDHGALKRRFEVHHLEMFANLAPGEKRRVIRSDLTVLCACCHRAIHAADGGAYVSDIELFRQKVLEL